MGADSFVPADRAQRDRIVNSLDETLFVEAGAGTGKTTALVGRIVSLVKAGVPVEGIAAITFTEAAAAELRERVRRELETASKEEPNEEVRLLCVQALRGLAEASLQTLHSFAGMLLKVCPLEAGLPPGFEIAEEIEADLRFDERWQRWLDNAMEDDLGPAVLRAMKLSMRLEDLRRIAKAFHDSYDLLAGARFDPRPAGAPRSPAEAVLLAADIRRLLPLARYGSDDALYAHAVRLAELAERMQRAAMDADDALIALERFGKITSRYGRKGDWETDRASGRNACELLKARLQDLDQMRDGEMAAARQEALLPLLAGLRDFALRYAEERKKEGKAQFHDLLVWARDMLRDKMAARAALQARFSHLLIDEFQDTDPIQAEIVFFLAEAPSDHPATNWLDVRLIPGKLFVVCDPKQSIYRFRRADIAAVELVRQRMHAEVITLTQNFRSQEPVIAWVNHVFELWMKAQEGQEGQQATYIALVPKFSPPSCEPPLGVHVMGEQLALKTEDLHGEEAKALAALLLELKDAPWQVRDESGEGLRAARYQDVCLLLRTRTNLRAIEGALAEANVPYRVESQSLVLGTQDVRELLSCLRAIDSPADQVALIAALRSPAFGCSDVELLEFLDQGGRFEMANTSQAGGPVAEVIGILRDFHEQRLWQAQDVLIERFIRERKMVETCFGRARPRERWRRLRFVVERARAFRQVGGSSLRAFLDWIERQAEEGARALEVPAPETDEDAVRIMTVHASKGLEFPIVVLAGLGAGPRAYSAPVIVRQDAVEVRVGISDRARFSTPDYEDVKEWEKECEKAELIRLMFVATTRAKDHLVVSLFRSDKGKNKACPAAEIERLCRDNPELWRRIPPSPQFVQVAARQADTSLVLDSAEDRERWMQQREAVLWRASRPFAFGVTKTLAKAETEEELSEFPHRRGRGGTQIGRAVHGVLQTVDLDTGSDVEAISRALAVAEGVAERWEEVARLAKVALQSRVVRRAVAFGRYYREVFVSLPVAGSLMEGYVDLIFETGEGLVIVDYKTDHVDDIEDRQRKDHYALQAGAYALAVQEVLGRKVNEAVLLFLHSDREVVFSDVPELAARAKARFEAAMGMPDAASS